MTNLETQYLQAVKEAAYGGTIFHSDINPIGMSKAQKSGVVSSLSKKNILSTDEEYGQIGIWPEDGDQFEIIYEISKKDVEELIARVQ